MMKRVVSIIFIIAVGAGCQKAGAEGGKCLEGNTCSSEDKVCSKEGICVHCGNSGEPCCLNGQECTKNLSCNKENVCSCGEWGQACCEGRLCGESPSSLFEVVCSPNNICEYCGGYEDPCCEDQSCREGFVCNQSGYCDFSEIEFCGTLEHPEPCEGGRCNGWLVLAEEINWCLTPFEYDINANESLCEVFSETTTNSTTPEESSDWCFWYAAFWKQDISICDYIRWDSIKEKCLELENPDDYYVLPSIDF